MADFETVVEAIQYRATEMPDKPAFIFRDCKGDRKQLTYADTYRLAGRWAHVLKSEGLGRGSLVANTLPNSPERVICESAILLSGAASVNAHCLISDGSDLLRTLKQSRAAAIVLDPDVAHSPWNVLQNYVRLSNTSQAASDDLPSLRRVFFIKRNHESGDEDFFNLLSKRQSWFKSDDVRPDDICTVFTTSGSTGFSKLVVHTHRNIVMVLNNTSRRYEGAWDRKECNMAPLGWIAGYVGNIFVNGNTRVLCDVRAGGSPSDMGMFSLNLVMEEKCDLAFYATPTIRQLINRLEADDNLKKQLTWIPDYVSTAGSPVTKSTLKAIGLLGKSLFVSYGATEFAIASTIHITAGQDFVDYDVGRPGDHVQLRIVNENDESILQPQGVLGHILLKSDGMFQEYLNDPATTSAAFSTDGFFRTGDVGKMDTRGHLLLYGRGGDAINHSTCIYYPGWLEMKMKEYPGVMDVVIVGVPDAIHYEEICVCVVMKQEHTIKEVRVAVEKDVLDEETDSMSLRPAYYLPFDSFPVLGAGKVDRKLVRQMAIKQILAISEEK